MNKDVKKQPSQKKRYCLPIAIHSSLYHILNLQNAAIAKEEVSASAFNALFFKSLQSFDNTIVVGRIGFPLSITSTCDFFLIADSHSKTQTVLKIIIT